MPHPSQFQQSYPPRQQPVQFNEEEYKASYDDLIDQYATPFGRNSQHATFALQDPPPLHSNTHRRGQSISKPSYSSETTAKLSDETEDTPRAYPPPLTPKEIDTRSIWQKWFPESLACRLYVMTVLIQTTIDLAIEVDLLVRFHEIGSSEEVSSHKMPVYLSIFALAHVFQFVMAVDAVYARNTLQFIGLAVFNGLFLVYAIIQIGEIRSTLSDSTSSGISHIPIEVLTATIPIVISVAELAYVALGWKIYNEFGWKVYKFLGADRRIKKMHANYQIFECLLKFDIFFWIGFSVQFIWLVLQRNDWEYYVTCAALPLSIILLVEGHLAASHENRWMMYTFMSGCVGAMVYFIFKLVKVLVYRTTPQYHLVYKSLSTFSMIAIVLLMATFVFAVAVLLNFGKGLKESLTKKKNPTVHRSGTLAHARAQSANPYRMSID